MADKQKHNPKRKFKEADRIGPARSSPKKLARDQNEKRRK